MGGHGPLERVPAFRRLRVDELLQPGEQLFGARRAGGLMIWHGDRPPRAIVPLDSLRGNARAGGCRARDRGDPVVVLVWVAVVGLTVLVLGLSQRLAAIAGAGSGEDPLAGVAGGPAVGPR